MVSFRIRVGLESLLIICLLQRYVVADEKPISAACGGSGRGRGERDDLVRGWGAGGRDMARPGRIRHPALLRRSVQAA